MVKRELQVGLMVEPQLGGTYRDLVGLARWAEETGFDVFARSDHYLDMDVSRPVTDAFVALAGSGDGDRLDPASPCWSARSRSATRP